jgi:hypothetical protein
MKLLVGFALVAISCGSLLAQDTKSAEISHFMQESGFVYLSDVRDSVDSSIKSTILSGQAITGWTLLTPAQDIPSGKTLDDLEDHIGINITTTQDRGFFFMLKLTRILSRSKYSEWFRVSTSVITSKYMSLVHMPANPATALMYDSCVSAAREIAKSGLFQPGECSMVNVNAAIKSDSDLNAQEAAKVPAKSKKNK